jgi:DNA-binding CsgD family transcriptional regulator
MTKSREQAEKLAPELTARQREVLQLIAEGKSPKEIAAILNVSPRTVEFHKYRIMEIVGARTIAVLTRYAVAHGIV